ncbi:unnamed protein product [Phytomonas sp. Hart1]|nr:unnamed protein product [Phytomonas sp. Hart1]|eukprot:CCW67915.1 unnamed protein product [Phytomonas sp. isolate Hart1]
MKNKLAKYIFAPLIDAKGIRSDGSTLLPPSTIQRPNKISYSSTTMSMGEKRENQYANFLNRTIFTIIMAYVFLASISLGILSGIPLVLTISVTMFYEITRINQKVRKERRLQSVQFLKWYFLVVCMVNVTLSNLRQPLLDTYPSLLPLYGKLPFLSFSFFVMGIVGFVLSLRKGMYRYQFIQLTWTAMTLMFVAGPCIGGLRNMIRGMIWFLLPVSCVINNDIWAYVFGKLFGHTKLLALSPKKTLEGFIGSFLFTVIWSFWFCGFLSYFPVMYCPAVGFTNSINSVCEKDPLFVQVDVQLPLWVRWISGNYLHSLKMSPAQKHAIVLGSFASLLAPFGGFFASGLKRAFKLKDFGDLIPGHGGMTDRMDCQGIMSLFTYFYLRTYVYCEAKCPTPSEITRCALNMGVDSRMSLFKELEHSLQG